MCEGEGREGRGRVQREEEVPKGRRGSLKRMPLDTAIHEQMAT